MSRRGSVLQGTEFKEFDFAPHVEAIRLSQNKQQLEQNKDKAAKADKDKKDKSDEEALNTIKDFNITDAGETSFDQIKNTLVGRAKTEAIEKLNNGATSNEIKIEFIPKLQKINTVHSIGKNEWAKIGEMQKQLLVDYPNANGGESLRLLRNAMYDNLIEYNEDGTIKGYKDPNLINPNINYTEKLFDFDNMDSWLPQTDDKLVANIQKTRGLTDLKDTLKIWDNKGGYEDERYEGQISIYERPILDKDKKVTGIELDSERVVLGKNQDGTPNVVQVMPREKYNVLRGDAQSAQQFDRKVYNYLSKDLGINPKKLDPQALDVYSRKYALDYLRNTKLAGSSYNRFKVDKPQQIKQTTNNHYGSGSGGAPVETIDIYKPVKEYLDKWQGKTTVRYASQDGTDKTVKYDYAPINIFSNEITDQIVQKAKERGYDADYINYARRNGEDWVMGQKVAGKVNPETDVALFKLTPYSNVSGNKPEGQTARIKALKDAKAQERKKQNPNKKNKDEEGEANDF